MNEGKFKEQEEIIKDEKQQGYMEMTKKKK